MNMSIEGWFDQIQQLNKSRRKKEDHFIQQMGAPNLFEPTKEPLSKKDKSGMGYWVVGNQIISMYISPTGRPQLSSRKEINANTIRLLAHLLEHGTGHIINDEAQTIPKDRNISNKEA